MSKVALTDGTGRFFDLARAREFEEKTRWDGHNHVSVVAGGAHMSTRCSTTPHLGCWVLNYWSQWQGVPETYDLLDPEEAYRWLTICGHYDEIPSKALQELAL